MGLPPYEPQQVPEGHYKFQVIAEPERRKKTSPATGNDFITILFSFKITDEDGRRNNGDSINIRSNPLYRGQLAYLRDILMAEHPHLDEEIVSERLDVAPNVAKLLIDDCQKSCEDTKG